MAEIAEALAVGPSIDGEVRIWLLVELRPGHAMDALLERQIRERIRAAASPRHVPERIFAGPDLPRTRSGKLVELAVRDLLEGRPPSNASTLANPEALETIRKICLA
jgi:acetoacetyl-CoA synthetase